MKKTIVYTYSNSGRKELYGSIGEFSTKFGISRNVWSHKNETLINFGFIFFIRNNEVIVASFSDGKQNAYIDSFLKNKVYHNLEYEPVKTNYLTINKQLELLKSLPELKSEPKQKVKINTPMARLETIAKAFHDTNEEKGFNSKTFEGCGTLVKNMDSETKVEAPLIGNLKINGKSITIIGSFVNNGNGNHQVILKGFDFDEKNEEEIVDKKIHDFFTQAW